MSDHFIAPDGRKIICMADAGAECRNEVLCYKSESINTRGDLEDSNVLAGPIKIHTGYPVVFVGDGYDRSWTYEPGGELLSEKQLQKFIEDPEGRQLVEDILKRKESSA